MKTFAALATLTLVAACGSGSTTAANCTSFSDFTMNAAIVEFGGSLGNNYVPRCVMVKKNQTVTFEGIFANHPISQTSGPPAIPPTNSGTTLTVPFNVAATYEYQCDLHHAAGMTGAVKAVP